VALQELVIVNPGKKSRRTTTKNRKVKKMATRRRTTRRKSAPARRATTRRRTTKRRAAPKRRRTTRRKATTKRRAAPKRRRTTKRRAAPKRRRTTKRRAAPKRRSTTRRRRTTRRKAAPKRRRTTRRRRTTKRRSPARRRTTRRRAAPKRRATSRRRRVSRRKSVRSRKMSMSGMYKFVMSNMTAFEAIASLGLGLVAGVKLPALAEKMVAKISGQSIDLTSGWRGPMVGAALTGALGYTLYGMKLVNFNVASSIALAGATVGLLNLANSYLNLPLPGVALMGASPSAGFGFLGGSNTLDNVSAFGYLGEAPFEPFGMSHEGGYSDMGRVVNVF
jgi:hypothetical protein